MLRAMGADPPAPDTDMWEEEERRRTFRGWPLERPSADAMARAGFSFTGSEDWVRCDFCGITLGNWEPNQNPLEKHRGCSPLCPFVRGHEVAAGGVPPGSAQPRGPGRDETGRDLFPQHVQPCQSAREMTSEQGRLRTFLSWPDSACVRPEPLAQAGFFYLGRDDLVQCFQCGLIAGAWEPGDDPWSEHARLSPGCRFVGLPELRPAAGGQRTESPTSTGTTRGRPILGQRPPPPAEEPSPVTLTVSEALGFGSSSGLVQESHDPAQSGRDQASCTSTRAPGVEIAPEQTQETTAVLGALRASTTTDPELEAAGASQAPGPVGQLTESRQDPGSTQGGAEWSGEPGPVQKAAGPNRGPTPPREAPESGPNQTPGLVHTTAGVGLGPDPAPELPNGESPPAAAAAPPPELAAYERLRDERLCKICMEREACVVFRPCNHLATCPKCSLELKRCCICRSPVVDLIQTYIS